MRIVRDERRVIDGEVHREVDVEDGEAISEMGWRVDTTDDGDLIGACRRIVERRSAAEVQGVLVDALTASTVVQIYDALSEANRAKMLDLVGDDMGRLGAFAWKLAARVQARS